MKTFHFLLTYFVSNCLGNLIILDKESDLNPSWSTSTSCTYGEIYSDFNKLQCKISPPSSTHPIHTEGFWTPCHGQQCELNYKFNNTKAFVPNAPGRVRVNGFISGNGSIQLQVEDPKNLDQEPKSIGRLYIVDHWSEESFDIMNITENMILKIIIEQNSSLSSDDVALLDKVVIESMPSNTEKLHSSSMPPSGEMKNELGTESILMTMSTFSVPTTTELYNLPEEPNSLELKGKDEDIIPLPLDDDSESSTNNNTASLVEPEAIQTPNSLESNIIEVSTTPPFLATTPSSIVMEMTTPTLPKQKPEEATESIAEPEPESEPKPEVSTEKVEPPEPEFTATTEGAKEKMDEPSPVPEATKEPEPEIEPTAEPEGTNEPKPETNASSDEKEKAEPEVEKPQADEAISEPAGASEPESESQTSSVENKLSESGAEKGQSPTTEPVAEAETDKSSAPEPVSESEPEKEPTSESEPEKEPTSESEPEKEPTAESGPEKEPTSETEPEKEPDKSSSKSEVEKPLTPEPEKEPVSEAEPEKRPTSETEPEKEPSPEEQDKSSSKTEALAPEPEKEPASESELEKSPTSQPEPKQDPAPEPEGEPLEPTKGPIQRDLSKITSKKSDSPVTEAYESNGKDGDSNIQSSSTSLALYIGIPLGTVLVISGLGLLFFMKKKKGSIRTAADDNQIESSP